MIIQISTFDPLWQTGGGNKQFHGKIDIANEIIYAHTTTFGQGQHLFLLGKVTIYYFSL